MPLDLKFEAAFSKAVVGLNLKIESNPKPGCTLFFKKERCCYGQVWAPSAWKGAFWANTLSPSIDLKIQIYGYNGLGYLATGSWFQTFADCAKRLAALKQYPVNPGRAIPLVDIQPHEFLHTNTKTCGKHVHVNNCVYSCAVRAIVAVDKKGKLSDNPHNPDKDNVWYEMDCKNQLGATFNILYDGQSKWLPADRYKKRLTTQMSPKNSVNLKNLSFSDRDVFDIAVGLFLDGEK